MWIRNPDIVPDLPDLQKYMYSFGLLDILGAGPRIMSQNPLFATILEFKKANRLELRP